MWFNKSATKQTSKSTQTFTVNYLGGHAELSIGLGKLVFYDDRIEFVRLKKVLLTIPALDIETYAIEGKEDVSRRITATRIVTLGVFALAAPKKNVQQEQCLTVILKNGNQLIFEHTNRFISEPLFKGLVSTAFAKMKR